jgi:hypothetical protein
MGAKYYVFLLSYDLAEYILPPALALQADLKNRLRERKGGDSHCRDVSWWGRGGEEPIPTESHESELLSVIFQLYKEVRII